MTESGPDKRKTPIVCNGIIYDSVNEFASALGTRSNRIRSKRNRGWSFEEIAEHYLAGRHKIGGAPKPVIVHGVRFESIKQAQQELGVSGKYLQRMRTKYGIDSEDALNMIVNKRYTVPKLWLEEYEGGAKASITNDP